MMQKAAEALGCDFVYTLIPKHALPLDRTHAQQQVKPRIQLDSSQLRGDAEQQRRVMQREYARRLVRPQRG